MFEPYDRDILHVYSTYYIGTCSLYCIFIINCRICTKEKQFYLLVNREKYKNMLMLHLVCIRKFCLYCSTYLHLLLNYYYNYICKSNYNIFDWKFILRDSINFSIKEIIKHKYICLKTSTVSSDGHSGKKNLKLFLSFEDQANKPNLIFFVKQKWVLLYIIHP